MGEIIQDYLYGASIITRVLREEEITRTGHREMEAESGEMWL
jgi:hypothetical protein